jgi:hypothetical protein
MSTENLKNDDEFELNATCINNSETKKPWTANLSVCVYRNVIWNCVCES